MGHVEEIVIVGGGPAGAYCALELARKGIYSAVFDHLHPREKPCAGGISPTALEKFPFLAKYRSQGNISTTFKMISCTNKQVAMVDYQGFNLSRQFLDEQIINMATQNGANLIKEKVLGVKKKEDLWQIRTDRRTITTKILVGADGINSLVRQTTVGCIPSENLGLGYGYFATGVEDGPTTVKFVAEIPGYIWIFPHLNNSCIGIGSESKYGGALKRILDDFIRSYLPQVKVVAKFAAMLPWVTNPDFFALPCAGENWVLVGDAAGHADPLTGEGILYALWSGSLAAEAIAKGDLESFEYLWRKEYGNDLKQRSSERENFYNPLRIEMIPFLSPSNRTKIIF